MTVDDRVATHDEGRTCEIVPLAEPYFEQLRQAVDVVAREKRFLSLTEAPPREDCYSFYKGLLENNSPVFVAVIADQVVGWCDIQSAFGQARQHVGTLGMGVMPAVRGRGLGTRLIESAIAQAWANGLMRIEITVRTDNEAATKLYERVGFEHEGRMRSSMLVDGQFYDCYAMALLHDAP